MIPRKSKGSKINSLITEKVEIQDSKEIANELNEYFVNVGPTLANKIDYDYSRDQCLNLNAIIVKSKFKLSIVRTETVKKAQQLSNDKATGIDGIPIKLLKLAIPFILDPLTHIVNLSLVSGTFPDDWKKAKVVALHKGGSKEPCNYRPILIPTVSSKVTERIAFDQFYGYLNDNSLINKFQSGFRPLHSTSTAMLPPQGKKQ